MEIEIPVKVLYALRALKLAGYEAYLVGGCVRDTILGRTVNDWDITTSADPEAMKRVFAGRKLIETGIRHGTLTLLNGGVAMEMTVFRQGTTLEEDLAHRDLTVNAMACTAEGELKDPFGGEKDTENGILRCVGRAEDRFAEDPLRILRALRFASALDMRIDPDTARVAFDMRDTLNRAAPERIRAELEKLLCGPAAGRVLKEYPEIIGAVLPEMLACVGFEQRNPYHDSDVWGHTVRAVEAVPPEPVLRWTMLLHDIGKPDTFTQDECGKGHFYEHAGAGERKAAEIMTRLRFDNRSRDEVLFLIHYHGLEIPLTEVSVKRAVRKYGIDRLRRLLPVFAADIEAQAPAYRGRLEEIRVLGEMAEEAAKTCPTLRDLAVNGHDLTELGYEREAVGRVLQALLDAVAENRCGNSKEELENYIAARRAAGRSPYVLPEAEP